MLVWRANNRERTVPSRQELKRDRCSLIDDAGALTDPQLLGKCSEVKDSLILSENLGAV